MPKLKKQNVNGRVENQVTQRPPNSLDEIWNTAKKPTIDLLSYENQLRAMDIVEIQTHARDEYHLMPKQDKNRMIIACLEQFNRKRLSQGSRTVQRGAPGMSRDAQKNVLNILKNAK